MRQLLRPLPLAQTAPSASVHLVLAIGPTLIAASSSLGRFPDHLSARLVRSLSPAEAALPFSANFNFPLPVQVGSIAGAYLLSVLLILTLIILLRRRRVSLQRAFDLGPGQTAKSSVPTIIVPNTTNGPRAEIHTGTGLTPYRQRFPSTASILTWQSSFSFTPTFADPFADEPAVVARTKMASDQLADLYKLVLAEEEERDHGQEPPSPEDEPAAKGRDDPEPSARSANATPTTRDFEFHSRTSSTAPLGSAITRQPSLQLTPIPRAPRREKPAKLQLEPSVVELDSEPDKAGGRRKSKGTALLSSLLSPHCKAFQRGDISAPILSPKSATYRPDVQELMPMSPRHYHNIPPPPRAPGTSFTPPETPRVYSIADRLYGGNGTGAGAINPLGSAPANAGTVVRPSVVPILPGITSQPQDGSPLGIDGQLHSPPEPDWPLSPASYISSTSSSPVVAGLPATPRSTRFSGFPLTPRASTFQFPLAPRPSVVRGGGALPLRAYEPMSPTSGTLTTAQIRETTFQNSGMLSPMSPGAVPYSPYQPQTPCWPMSTSLVTKADRKRTKQLEPRTPTVEMVKNDDEVW